MKRAQSIYTPTSQHNISASSRYVNFLPFGSFFLRKGTNFTHLEDPGIIIYIFTPPFKHVYEPLHVDQFGAFFLVFSFLVDGQKNQEVVGVLSVFTNCLS